MCCCDRISGEMSTMDDRILVGSRASHRHGRCALGQPPAGCVCTATVGAKIPGMNEFHALSSPALRPLWSAIHARLSSGRPVSRVRVGPLGADQRRRRASSGTVVTSHQRNNHRGRDRPPPVRVRAKQPLARSRPRRPRTETPRGHQSPARYHWDGEMSARRAGYGVWALR